MLIRAPAILCASRSHGEHGAIVRLLTAEHGLAAAYVAGARGRELRPLLIPGNLLEVEVRARTATQLPSARLELVASRGPWLSEPLPSAGIGWACALTAATLPEGHSYPPLYQGLGALLDAICHAPSARGWARVLAGYEVLLLREIGYGATPAPAAGGMARPARPAGTARQGYRQPAPCRSGGRCYGVSRDSAGSAEAHQQDGLRGFS